HLRDLETATDGLALADDAVFMRLVRIAFLHGDDIAAGLFVKLDHFLQAALLGLHDHIRQQKSKRLVADKLARAPDRMAKTKRHLLAGEAGRARLRLDILKMLQFRRLAALGERGIKLYLRIEIVFDDCLVASGDENQMFDTSFARLIDYILDDGLVDDRQHFFRDRFGGGQETGAKTCDREHGLANFSDRTHSSPRFHYFRFAIKALKRLNFK